MCLTNKRSLMVSETWTTVGIWPPLEAQFFPPLLIHNTLPIIVKSLIPSVPFVTNLDIWKKSVGQRKESRRLCRNRTKPKMRPLVLFLELLKLPQSLLQVPSIHHPFSPKLIHL